MPYNYNIFQGGTNPQNQTFNPQYGAAPTVLGVQPKLQGPGAINGSINIPKVKGATVQKSELDLLREEIDRLTREISNTTLSSNIDVAGIFSKAQQKAIQAQTPQFNREKEIFIDRIKQRRGEIQDSAVAQNEALKVDLENRLEDIATGRSRTAQDVTRNKNELDVAEQQFQQDEGVQFQEDRALLADQVAGSGLTTSGLGKKKITQAENQRNVASARALQTIEGKREAQDIFKTRTFEDYSTSEVRSRAQNKAENEAVNRELKKELNKIAYDEVTGTRDLERQFQRDVFNEQNNQAKILFEQALTGIADPRTRQATREAYGGFF